MNERPFCASRVCSTLKNVCMRCLFFRYVSEPDKRVQTLDTNGGCRVKSLVIKACDCRALTICQEEHHPLLHFQQMKWVFSPRPQIVQWHLVPTFHMPYYTCKIYTLWKDRKDGQMRLFCILYLKTELYLFSSIINILICVWVKHTAGSWLEDSGDGRSYIFLWILSGFWEFLFKRCFNLS